MRTSNNFYRAETSRAYKQLFFAVVVICVLIVVAYFGWGSYFVRVSESKLTPKTCDSFTLYEEMEAWLKDHPEDFKRLNGNSRGKFPGIPCDDLYTQYMLRLELAQQKARVQ